MSATRVLPRLAVALWAAAACTGDGSPSAERELATAVYRLALDTLFDGRERARQLVIWPSDAGDGPTFEALPHLAETTGARRPIDADRFGASLPARVIGEPELERLFRENPDGWAAFYAAFPGAPGLVELLPVRVTHDGLRAETYVGRACGEHCRNAWRVSAARVPGGAWRVHRLEWIHVPGV
jgi:hypothetical protein